MSQDGLQVAGEGDRVKGIITQKTSTKRESIEKQRLINEYLKKVDLSYSSQKGKKSQIKVICLK